jgi:hypothetical protein
VIDLPHGSFKIASEDDQHARRVKLNGNVLTFDQVRRHAAVSLRPAGNR